MKYLTIRGSTAMKGPNLICPYPGFSIRFEFNETAVEDQALLLDQLKSAANFIYEKPSSLKKLKIPEVTGSFNTQVVEWIGVISILIQRQNGNETSLYRSFSPAGSHQHDLFVAHEFQSMGSASLSTAVRLVRHLTDKSDVVQSQEDANNFLEKHLTSISAHYQRWAPRMETRAFMTIARKRGIPFRFNDERTKFLEFGYGRKKRIFLENIIDTESHNSFALTNDKNLTAKLLNDVGLPGTVNKRASSFDEVKAYAEELGYPVVVKPLMGMQGYGVSPNINSEEELKTAYEAASQHHSSVVVERHVKGDDHRMLVIGGKYAGCVKRSITKVIGDGKRSIEEIVAEINKLDFRNRIPGNPKYQITKIPIITEVLKKQGYDWETVPQKGDEVAMHIVPNASQGGMLEAIKDKNVHPANIDMAERAALQFDLKLGGIDYLTEDISAPYWESGGAICEVNARPAIDIMELGDPIVQERLCRKTFELSFKPEEDHELPVIVIVGSDEVLGFELVTAAQTKGLRVAHKYEQGVQIGLAKPVLKDRPDMAVDAALWDASVDIVILQEDGARIRKYGVGFEISSLAIFMEIPRGGDKPIPQINTLLARTAIYGGFYLNENPELAEWVNSLDDKLKSKLKPLSLVDMKKALISHISAL